MKRINILLIIIGLALAFTACEDYLKENPPGELAPESFLATQEGVEGVLNSAYVQYKFNYSQHNLLTQSFEYPGDIMYETGGGMNINFVRMANFQWTSSSSDANAVWNTKYESIRDANIVIDNLDNIEDENTRAALLAEARYIRAIDYVYLYDNFGPVPLRTSALDEPNLPRATEEEFQSFVISELEAAAAGLPNPGTEVYGKGTKGAALAFLTRFYMTIKEWQKGAETAKRVMDLGYYELFPSYHDLFKVENEHDKNPNNKEMIAVSVCTHTHPYGNKIPTVALPPGFWYTDEIPEFKAEGIANWAANFRFYDWFIETFDKEKDDRFSLIFGSYVNNKGVVVDLTTQAHNYRTLKYFDNMAEGASHGADFPMFRYADILMLRAEALNEINGPNAECISLINQVRIRAGVDEINADDFTKESLRDFILEERGREFYYEALRRSDLIRHGKLIERALDRGIANAADYHNRYPIPQAEMDANPNMEQNPGY